MHIIVLKPKKGLVDLNELVGELGKSEIASLMIEGGAELSGNAIKEGIIDKVLIFTAPKIIGNGLEPIKNLGIKKVDKAINLKNVLTKKIGKDLLVEGNL